MLDRRQAMESAGEHGARFADAGSRGKQTCFSPPCHHWSIERKDHWKPTSVPCFCHPSVVHPISRCPLLVVPVEVGLSRFLPGARLQGVLRRRFVRDLQRHDVLQSGEVLSLRLGRSMEKPPKTRLQTSSSLDNSMTQTSNLSRHSPDSEATTCSCSDGLCRCLQMLRQPSLFWWPLQSCLHLLSSTHLQKPISRGAG